LGEELGEDTNPNPVVLADLMELESDSIPEWGFSVLGVLGVDGESRLETQTFGNPTIATLVGVLEIIKAEIVLQVLEEE
jgi:hypothetical protein